MRFMDVCARESYTKDGAEKVSWNKIGSLMVKEDGKMYLKLSMVPGVLYSVFEPKPKENKRPEVDWNE